MHEIENWQAATGHDVMKDNFLSIGFHMCGFIFLQWLSPKRSRVSRMGPLIFSRRKCGSHNDPFYLSSGRKSFITFFLNTGTGETLNN